MSDPGIGQPHDDIVYPSAIPFLLVHLACFGALWSGVTWQAIAVCIALYWLRMFAIGAGYHRYFSHRAYSTSRPFQFILAFLAQSSAQRGVLWWAAKHRHHHLHSDAEDDVHSPRQHGFLYSHVGWIFARRHDDFETAKVADLAAFPELVWLQRWELVPAFVVAALCFALAGWSGLFVGYVWSTVMVYHATFCINSLAHVHGKQRFVTGDDSRNNWLLAIMTMGEGWHNNHHAFQSSARQGFKWWELDLTYYILRGLNSLGLVWNLKEPPESVLRNEQKLGSRVIARTAEQLAARFNVDQIAASVQEALHATDSAVLRARLQDKRLRAAEVVSAFAGVQLPGRDELFAEAKAIFPATRSLDEIVVQAHDLLLASIGAKLRAR